jgi:hypothetical protein
LIRKIISLIIECLDAVHANVLALGKHRPATEGGIECICSNDRCRGDDHSKQSRIRHSNSKKLRAKERITLRNRDGLGLVQGVVRGGGRVWASLTVADDGAGAALCSDGFTVCIRSTSRTQRRPFRPLSNLTHRSATRSGATRLVSLTWYISSV